MPRLGYKQTDEHKRNRSNAIKGMKLTTEQKKKISDSKIGKTSTFKGKKHTIEAKRKIGIASIGRISGEKNPNFNGWISKELYGFEWTDLLKHSIRTRDCFTCNICKKNGWVVHHIDYNKKNNNPENLITVCHSCHMKTNFKREYWIKYFNKL